MKRALLATLFLSAACASSTLKPGESVTTYTLPDWSSKPARNQDTPSKPAVAARTTAFHIETPEGYKPAGGVLSPPVAAMYVKPLYEGEAALIVERYTQGDSSSTDKAAFASRLGRSPVLRRLEGKDFEVYEGIKFESLGRSIPSDDPYADRLGSQPPPLLNPLEGRRFPPGGDAFRLYRCRKRGAWGLLRQYRKARDQGDLDAFRSKEFGAAERGLVSACFGRTTILAMGSGDEVPDIPKPSMRSLRELAREEWATGASPRVEREAVHLRDFPGGFYALRLRAPTGAFAGEYPAFAKFIAGFRILTSP